MKKKIREDRKQNFNASFSMSAITFCTRHQVVYLLASSFKQYTTDFIFDLARFLYVVCYVTCTILKSSQQTCTKFNLKRFHNNNSRLDHTQCGPFSSASCSKRINVINRVRARVKVYSFLHEQGKFNLSQLDTIDYVTLQHG